MARTKEKSYSRPYNRTLVKLKDKNQWLVDQAQANEDLGTFMSAKTKIKSLGGKQNV